MGERDRRDDRDTAPSRFGGLLRAVGLRPAPPPPPPAADPPAPRATTDAAEAKVADLWRFAREIPSEAAREAAFAVCVAADRVAEVLAEDRAEPELVGWFVERYLDPVEALLERYVRLARRGVAAAEPTLAKVEEQDLPLLTAKLEALYDRLHRGDVVDLAVASEMLDLPDRPPSSSRPRSS